MIDQIATERRPNGWTKGHASHEDAHRHAPVGEHAVHLLRRRALPAQLAGDAAAGAEPVGVVDHLQFASPEDPEIFWTFTQAVNAIVDYCKFMDIPVVGGKVSFYNETVNGPIKPSPVIGTLGLVDDASHVTRSALQKDDSIFVIGHTSPEMGGSEEFDLATKGTKSTKQISRMQALC